MPRKYEGEPEKTREEVRVVREAANVAKGWPKGAGGEGRVLDPALQRRIDKALKNQQKEKLKKRQFKYRPMA